VLAISTIDKRYGRDSEEPPPTAELLHAVKLRALLAALSAAFARDPPGSAAFVIDLVRRSRLEARRVLERDTEGGQELIDAGARSQQLLVAPLDALPGADAVPSFLASAPGVRMLEAAVQADCTVLLAYKGVQAALHRRWHLWSHPRNCLISPAASAGAP
jgi:hypothetical protein